MMFQEGQVKNYNQKRGFGFIQISGESREVFFHIKDFPNNNLPPKVGENLKFRIVEDAGKLKAANIVRLDLKAEVAVRQENHLHAGDMKINTSLHYEKTKSSATAKIVAISGLIIFMILTGFIYNKYQGHQAQKQLKLKELMLEQQRIVAEQRAAQGDLPALGLSEKGKKNLENSRNSGVHVAASSDSHSSQFKCDGRTHCSQMNSYDEALYFLKNCPNTQMDGNNDGIPCERQFKDEISKRHLFR